MRAFCERVQVLFLAVGMLLAAGTLANAQGFEAALSGFTADSFNDTESAIGATARSGDPRAAQVIEALQDGRLLFSPESKKVYIKDKAGALVDAVTGQAVAGPEPTDLKVVRINNRMRRAIEAA